MRRNTILAATAVFCLVEGAAFASQADVAQLSDTQLETLWTDAAWDCKKLGDPWYRRQHPLDKVNPNVCAIATNAYVEMLLRAGRLPGLTGARAIEKLKARRQALDELWIDRR